MRARSSSMVTRDQRDGGEWVSLGSYIFNSGPASVVLSDDASGIVIADAVKLVYVN